MYSCTLVFLAVAQKQPSVKGKARKEASPGVNDAQVNHILMAFFCLVSVTEYTCTYKYLPVQLYLYIVPFEIECSV